MTASEPEITRGLAPTFDSAGTLGGSSGQESWAHRPGQVLGHFRLVAPLGAGGFGQVWQALDLRLEREIAIKVLAVEVSRRPGSRALLEAEARTVARLKHPGIVTLHALEEADGHLLLVMERVEGKTLAETIPPEGLPLRAVLDLGIQLCEALGAAHGHGIIHRDLNPRNLMVTDEGRVKILDFGLALRQAAVQPLRSAKATQDSSGGMTGTLPYMSPEQMEGRLLDARSDLFSLGVVLYEMATGDRPFHGDNLVAQMKATLSAEPVWPAAMPLGLAAVLRRCLAKEPAQRFSNCHELQQALLQLEPPEAAKAPEQPFVAVLPFTDLSDQQDEGYFCEGMAEEVLAALSRAPGLRLASRASSFHLKEAGIAAQEIGRRLGVDSLLCGSVRKEQGRLRISVELMDVATGLQQWAERYDRERFDIFALQEEIAGHIAGALRLTLQPVAEPRNAVDLEAYEDYLRGRQYYFRYNRHGMRFAMQMFQQALEREPTFAPAWAGIANCAAFLFIYADRSEVNRAQADAASARALELDPRLAEAHASRGVALSASGRMEDAEAAFLEALRLDPNLYEASYFYARHCLATGQLTEAAERFEAAALIRPEDCQAVLLVAQVYTDLGRPEAAEAARRQGLALVEERLRHVPDDVRARYLGANALIALGETEKGLAWARMARGLDPDDPMLLYNLGCIHALAGQSNEALDCLSQAIRAGLTQKGWFLHDGDLASIRALPRFQALLTRLA